ncbi:MAG: hypothetical protein JXB26_09725 [Candidatus Aminicenantes bacterium]|nr:hypothetical protein [Candidatus Aminicenantes bacterium]
MSIQRRRYRWYDVLCTTRRNIKVFVNVFNIRQRYSRVWVLYGTQSRNTRKARQGFFQYMRRERNGYFASFTTREVSGMRIGIDYRGRLQRSVYISPERIVGNTPNHILTEGAYTIEVDVNFDDYDRGYEDAVSTRLVR